MARGGRFEDFDGPDRLAVVLGNEWAAGQSTRPHRHTRAQLLYGARGLITVSTGQGAWVVPPERAVWIPAGVVHEVSTLAPVSTCSLFVAQDTPGVPAQCQVVGISTLVRSLLLEAVDLPLDVSSDLREGGRDGLLVALLLQEIRRLPRLGLGLPLPSEPRLAALCRSFLAAPDPHATIDAWAGALGLSRRGFTRLFRAQTGLGLQGWRQQACLFAALPRLAAGEAVTRVALDLGYDSPAAFTAMFRRLLGASPVRYLRGQAR